MADERYKVVTLHDGGRNWFFVVDSWATESEKPAVEYSFLTRAASDNAARQLNKIWAASAPRRRAAQELEG